MAYKSHLSSTDAKVEAERLETQVWLQGRTMNVNVDHQSPMYDAFSHSDSRQNGPRGNQRRQRELS